MKKTKECFLIMVAIVTMLGWVCYYYSPVGPSEDRLGDSR